MNTNSVSCTNIPSKHPNRDEKYNTELKKRLWPVGPSSRDLAEYPEPSQMAISGCLGSWAEFVLLAGKTIAELISELCKSKGLCTWPSNFILHFIKSQLIYTARNWQQWQLESRAAFCHSQRHKTAFAEEEPVWAAHPIPELLQPYFSWFNIVGHASPHFRMYYHFSDVPK